MKVNTLFFIGVLLIFIGCSKSDITMPPISNDSNLVNTKPPPFKDGATIKIMEGIYGLSAGSKDLGSKFVCKVSKYKVSFFSEKEGIFIILKYGSKSDGSIQFSGFWRYSEKPDQGHIQFSISETEGATELLEGKISTSLKLQGVFSGQLLTLQYNKAFSSYAANNPFKIFAHHGVQTTADPPFAENSRKAALYVGDYGATGWEVDVRLTKDHVPILIHDANINVRLTQKGPMFGTWDQYNFAYITQFVRLIDGQSLPSVAEALKTFVDSTSMKYVWLDIKGNEGVFKYLEPVVRDAYSNAAAQGRDIVILTGLPNADAITEFNTQPSYKSGDPSYSYKYKTGDPPYVKWPPTSNYKGALPTLCEETIDKAIDNGSIFFGPRYSLGLLLEDVAKGHSRSPRINAVSWTLNAKSLIFNYLDEGQFDGFITDYPAYAVYHFYTTK